MAGSSLIRRDNRFLPRPSPAVTRQISIVMVSACNRLDEPSAVPLTTRVGQNEQRYLIGRAGNRELWRIARPGSASGIDEAIVGWRVHIMPDGSTRASLDQQVFRSEAAGRDWLVSS